MFYIKIDYNNKAYYLRVDRIKVDSDVEQYQIVYGKKAVIIQTNKPYVVRNNYPLDQVVYRSVSGTVNNKDVFNKMFDALKLAVE